MSHRKRPAQVNWPLGLQLYLKGVSKRQIAVSLNCSYSGVMQHARIQGWKDILRKCHAEDLENLQRKAGVPWTPEQLGDEARAAAITEVQFMLKALPKDQTKRAKLLVQLSTALRSLTGPARITKDKPAKKAPDRVDLDALRE